MLECLYENIKTCVKAWEMSQVHTILHHRHRDKIEIYK